MKYNIREINKAELLVALFENAKGSKWTSATIGKMMCPDDFVRDMNSDLYQPRIDAKISKLTLNKEQAQHLLDTAPRMQIDYIEEVAIQIRFSDDEIDTTEYDKKNAGSNGAKTASEVIEQFRPKSVAAPRSVPTKERERN